MARHILQSRAKSDWRWGLVGEGEGEGERDGERAGREARVEEKGPTGEMRNRLCLECASAESRGGQLLFEAS